MSGPLDSFEGSLLYPSGSVAATACKTDEGYLHTFTSDGGHFQVLASFDEQGLGAVSYSNGRPWLVVTEEGWTVSDAKGSITERGKHPRKDKQPIVCAPTKDLTVAFYSTRNIDVTLQLNQSTYNFQCGQRSRVEARKAKPADAAAKNNSKAAAVAGTASDIIIADLEGLRKRLQRVGVSAMPLYGTLHPGKAQLPGTLPDMGSPPLSKQQQAKLRREAPKVVYTPKRSRLPLVSTAQWSSSISSPAGAEADVLTVVCVLADWVPACRHVERQVEGAKHLLEALAANSSAAEAAHIQVVKMDASEAGAVLQRYNFKTLPMLLMYYAGQLVFAGNSLRGEQQIQQEAIASLRKGRKSEFLPAGFTFTSLQGNSLLEGIWLGMSLQG